MTDQHIIDSVQRADPVPDLERLPEPRHDALTLLAVAEKERAMKTTTRGHAPTEPPRHRWLRPMTAFAAALVLMLGAIGVVAFVSDDEPPGGGIPDTVAPTNTMEGPASTTTVPEPLITTEPPTPSTTSPLRDPITILDGTWIGRELDFFAAGVFATSHGFFAGGEGGLWLSRDGTRWTNTLTLPLELMDPQPSDLGPDENPVYSTFSFVSSVVEHDSHIYAFGSISGAVDGSLERFVWRSDDGLTWTHIPFPSVGGGSFAGAAVAGGRLLAYLNQDCAGSGSAALFLSENGTDWVTIGADEAGLSNISLSNVIAYEGRFLGVGVEGCTYSDEYPNGKRMMYASATGESWTPVIGSEFSADAYPDHTVAIADGVIYLGGSFFDGSPRPALWRSNDGRSFQQIDLDPAIRKSWGRLVSVVPTPRGVLAIAWLGARGEEPMRIVLLGGNDVATLEVIQTTNDLYSDAFAPGPNGAAFFDDHAVIVGQKGTGGLYSWIWTPDS